MRPSVRVRGRQQTARNARKKIRPEHAAGTAGSRAAAEPVELIVPLVLSGGSGTRLWPLSRNLYPKQLLPLASNRSLLAETVLRVADSSAYAAPIIVCNQEHRFIVAEQVLEADATARAIVLEPLGRNTAPAVAVACLLAQAGGEDPLLLVLPSDHIVQQLGEFKAAVETAARAAAKGHLLVTFGIKPTKPETGYGYIRRGNGVRDVPGAYAVSQFVEKPDESRARRYLKDGRYLWNSGMFLFRASSYLAELKAHAPEVLAAAEAAVAGAERAMEFVMLAEAPLRACPDISIDNAVMEKTRRAAVVPADLGWSDVGSWSALWELSEKDAAGNVVVGDVIVDGSRSSYIRSDRRLVAAVGVENLVVIATEDAVLVMHRDRAQDIKSIVGRLKSFGRKEIDSHVTVRRPWGHYHTVDAGNRFAVKRITVKPGKRLSLQSHMHRAEHWIVVSGTARVTRGEETIIVRENESTYIPLGVQHRLENPGKLPLDLIEVQSGAYLEEDDIIRFSDDFNRT